MKKQKASALLYIFIIISIASTITIAWWYKSSMNYDVVLAREKFYKNLSMTELVLSYGINIAKINCDDILCAKNKMPFNLNMKFVIDELLKYKNNFDAEFILERIEGWSIRLLAVLLKNNKKICSIKCLLKRKYSNDSEPEFNIKYYTISNFA